MVLESSAQYCPPERVVNNKGDFRSVAWEKSDLPRLPFYLQKPPAGLLASVRISEKCICTYTSLSISDDCPLEQQFQSHLRRIGTRENRWPNYISDLLTEESLKAEQKCSFLTGGFVHKVKRTFWKFH